MLSEATADEEIGHISSFSWSCLCMDAEHVCKTERSASLIYKNWHQTWYLQLTV